MNDNYVCTMKFFVLSGSVYWGKPENNVFCFKSNYVPARIKSHGFQWRRWRFAVGVVCNAIYNQKIFVISWRGTVARVIWKRHGIRL